MRRLSTVLLCCWVCFVSALASADTQYWDTGVGAGLQGGSGNWDTSTLTWNDSTGSGAQVAWTNGNNAVFSTTGGTVTVLTPITAPNITANVSMTIKDDGLNPAHPNTLDVSTITVPPASAVQTTIQAKIVGNHDLTIIDNNAALINNNVALGLVGGGVNSFTGNVNLNGTGAGTTSASRLALLINTPGIIPATATFNYGRNMSQVDFNVAGDHGNVPNNFVLNSTNVVDPNFEGWIGALGSATVNLTGQISGSSTLTFGLGGAGGAGIITLSPSSGLETYTGNTRFTIAQTGVVKLGASNVLPASTGLIWGTSASVNAIGSLDLNGNSQTIASLTSAVPSAVVQNGIVNTQATTSTLTVNGSATTTYFGPLGSAANPTNLPNPGNHANIKLVLAGTNTGQLTLSTASGMAYSGGTEINGGTLVVTNTSNSGTGTGNITTSGTGSLKIGDGTTAGAGSVSGTITDDGNVTFNRPDSVSYGNAISGTGTLTKIGAGALTLTASNGYSGGTTISAGSLTASGASATVGGGNVTVTAGNLGIASGVSNAIADTATLSLLGGGTAGVADQGYADLGSGINELVGSLLLNGAAQLAGTYGSTLSSATFKNNEYFAGLGILTVGLQGDYNGDGKVDAADYVTWRKNPGGFPANAYDTWRANFGNPPGSGSSRVLGPQFPSPLL